MDKPKTHRVFFALWPDQHIRQAISKDVMSQFENLSGRKVSQQQWHITLAFLGNISEEMFICVQQQAGQISAQQFDLILDTIGYWSRPKVAWLGCAHVPETALNLVNSLNAALQPCGYEPEYKDFKAHMTLMRKVTRKPKAFEFESIPWSVKQFVLVESELTPSGSNYNVIARWDLLA